VEFVPEEKVVYDRNPAGYWLDGAANLAHLTIWFVPDVQTALNGVQTGDYDAVWTAAQPEQAETAAATGDFNIYEMPLSGPDGIGLRITHQKLGDIRVRQAIAHAINRQPLADAVYGKDACTPIPVPAPPNTPLYVANYDPYPYDPDKARALLKEAGAEGMTIELYDDGRSTSSTGDVALQQQLADVGLNPVIIPSEAGAGGTFADGQHDSFYTGWVQQDHVLGFLTRYFVTGGRFQLAAGEDTELLALMDQARQPGLTESAEADIYHEIGKLITDLAVMIPICLSHATVVANDKVLNVETAHRWTVWDTRFLAVAK
jgi:ABC-type transport system substrate-binding protein